MYLSSCVCLSADRPTTAVTGGHFIGWIEQSTESRIPLLRGFLCGLFGLLVPKVYFGVKTMCKKFHKVATLGCDLTIFTKASNAVTAVL